MTGTRLPIPPHRGGGTVLVVFGALVLSLVVIITVQLVRQAPDTGSLDPGGDIGRVDMNELRRRQERDIREAAALLLDSTGTNEQDWRSPIPRITAADTMDLDSLFPAH